MNIEIEELIERAQDRYLEAEELDALEAYVQSLPERIELYKLLRDREVDIMQAVAERTEAELPKVAEEDLERGIKNLLLVVRYCAMGMLLNNEEFIQIRLLKWLEQIVSQFDMRNLNETLYKSLNQVLKEELSDEQLGLIQTTITSAQVNLIY
jgi:methanogenic corrinoid protein MtbC1